MNVYADRIGQVVDGWTVIEKGRRNRQGKRLWLLRHESGREKYLPACRIAQLDRPRVNTAGRGK